MPQILNTPNFSSSHHPSILSITAIAEENTDFGGSFVCVCMAGSVIHKDLPTFVEHVFSRVFGRYNPFRIRPCSPVITSNWPLFARQSAECIGTCTLACVPMMAPGCTGQNILVSRASGLRCRPGVKRIDPTKGAREPTKAPRRFLSPFVIQGFCEFLCTTWELTENVQGKTEDTNHRTRSSKCRTHSTTIFRHALFCDFFVSHSLSNSKLTHSRTSTSLFVKKLCQCTD